VHLIEWIDLGDGTAIKAGATGKREQRHHQHQYPFQATHRCLRCGGGEIAATRGSNPACVGLATLELRLRSLHVGDVLPARSTASTTLSDFFIICYLRKNSGWLGRNAPNRAHPSIAIATWRLRLLTFGARPITDKFRRDRAALRLSSRLSLSAG
jgi:hypothetical protein